jgi:hypothetical protein
MKKEIYDTEEVLSFHLSVRPSQGEATTSQFLSFLSFLNFLSERKKTKTSTNRTSGKQTTGLFA